MDGIQDFKSLQDQVQSALILATRTAGQISSEDLGFQRSLNPELGTFLDEQSERLLALSNDLLTSAASISGIRAPVLEDQDDVENNWRSVVDVIDSLLEKADTSLDEYTGVIKRRASPPIDLEISKSKKPNLGNAFRPQNLVKPQLAFNVKPNNSEKAPWKPLLTTKPHARLPLEQSLLTFRDEFDQSQYEYTDFLPILQLPLDDSRSGDLSKFQKHRQIQYGENLRIMGITGGIADNRVRYRHPYETEILQLQYPDIVYQKSDPIPYLPVESTSAIFVDTLEGVFEMLEELKKAKEIAVDLEHHDARSYVGLVSLMQISTRQKDWIVDTLKPWRQDLQILNEVFADPNIVKVFHGAYMDIVWLQRDLGLYIVGLFDTHHASRTLGYQGGSLAFLLKKFINFDADKKYQLADWRIRPIPEEMLFYARADTHFLLYIYDKMKNELIDKTNPEMPGENRIDTVLQKSKETSLLRYERQIYHADTGKGPGGWYTLLMKTPSLFNNEQFSVFRAVHEWRDEIARIDDDSTSFVMPNHVIFKIAKLLPNDMVALLGIAHPISHSVKSRTGELLDLIKSAKASGKDGPSMMDILRPDSVGAVAKAKVSSFTEKNAAPVAVLDETQLRSDESSFWGSAFGSSIWDAPTAKSEDMRLAVPLPALSSEIFEAPQFVASDTNNALTDRSRLQTQTPSRPASPKANLEEAFILKRGDKRKSDAISETEEIRGDSDVSLPKNEAVLEVGAERHQQRAEPKEHAEKAPKEEKRARKARREEKEKAAGTEDMDEEPFDYSKAESVLHGKSNGEDGQSGKKAKKPFDPYVKSADAPTGMRRLQTERPGKSHTFKS